ncbi:MAG: PHP domain-containing protein [Clostridia bacterium]
MIDLHCHSTASDGENNAITLLKMAEKKKLDVFALTDHDDCTTTKFVMEQAKKLFSGIFVSGIELTTSCLKQGIELLCYGFDPTRLESELKKVNHPTYWSAFKKQFIMLLEAMDRAKAILSNEVRNFANLPVEDIKKLNAKKLVLKDFLSHEENFHLIDDISNFKSFSNFYRKEFTNPRSKFFADSGAIFASPEKIYEIVHACGGLVFLAHDFNYGEQAIPVLNELTEKHLIDGIECMHKNFTKENQDYLFEYARKHNLFTSGGSDFHRESSSPFAKASLNQEIPTSLIKPWIDKITGVAPKK